MWSFSSIAIFVVQSALAAAYVVVVLRAVSKIDWTLVARSFIKRWKALACPANNGGTEKVLAMKMQESRLLNLQAVCWFIVWTVFPVFFIVSSLEVFGKTLSGEANSALRLTGLVSAFLVCLFPRLLTVKTLRAWQWVWFLLACAHIAPGICPPEMLSLRTRMSLLFLTVLNCALLHNVTSLVQHSLYLLVAVACLSRSPIHSEEWRWHFRLEIISAAWSCACVAMMQRLVEAQQRSSIEAACLAEKQLANGKLLGMFYEVVLEVDSDLDIVSSDPELGLFLPHGAESPIPPLLGTNLTELLPDEQDRQLLWQRTHSPPVGEEASVDVMHLRMRHNGSNSLRVELFSLHFQSCTGQWRHLFGVREFGDEEAGPGIREPYMVLQVDTFDPGFTIVGISTDMQHELGDVALGSSLCEFLADVPGFRENFEFAINNVLCDDGPEPNACFQTVLRPHRRRGRRVRLLASCCITLDDPPGDEADAGCIARLSFSNLEPVGRTGSTSSSRSSGSRGSGRLRGTPGQLHSQPLGYTPRASTLGAGIQL